LFGESPYAEHFAQPEEGLAQVLLGLGVEVGAHNSADNLSRGCGCGALQAR
jgi:hypothetical protein